MAQVKLSERIPVTPAEAWALVSDLSRLGEWLSLHEAWRGDLPELAPGAQLTGIVKTKGIRNKVTWVVGDFDPPHRISLSGEGVGGTKVALDMAVSAEGETSRFDFRVDFSHPTLRGPLGSIAGRAIKGDIESSVGRFKKLV
jgi:carbon monoxide dehydrogenase subunit G